MEKRSNGLDVNALDLGLRIPKAAGVKNVFLYLPFTLGAGAVTDLGKLLKETEIATAIFNETTDVAASSSDVSKFLIKTSSMQLSCWILDINADIKFTDVKAAGGDDYRPSGTILEFGSQVFDLGADEGERYIRFRINLTKSGLTAFFTRYDPPDRGLLSGYEEIEVVDFRLNEARNLPRAVLNNMCAGFVLKQINYLALMALIVDMGRIRSLQR